MPRRYAPKRRLIRRKRLARRPMRRMKRTPQPIQYFKRSNYLSGWTVSSTTADIFGTYFGSLNQISGVSDFTGLYDQFKILGLKWSLIPRGNSSDISPSGTSAQQSVGVFSVIDYNDSTALTSLNQAVQYANLKMTRSHQVHSRYFKPRITPTIENGVGGTASALTTRGWLDVSTGANVPHYGIKYVLQQAPNVAQTFDLKVDYYLAFKNVK